MPTIWDPSKPAFSDLDRRKQEFWHLCLIKLLDPFPWMQVVLGPCQTLLSGPIPWMPTFLDQELPNFLGPIPLTPTFLGPFLQAFWDPIPLTPISFVQILILILTLMLLDLFHKQPVFSDLEMPKLLGQAPE